MNKSTLLFLPPISLGFVALVVALGTNASAQSASLAPSRSTVVLDAVVATVDEHPILLSDLNRVLPNALSFEAATHSSEARAALDRLVYEHLLQSEAEQRRISVSDNDVERYVDEVARANNFSREQFVDALKAQGKSWTEYRAQVRTDILQTRLASIMLQGRSTVTDEELDKFFSDNPHLLTSGATVTLRKLTTTDRSLAEQVAGKRISESDFTQAQAVSGSGAGDDGGVLAQVPERDLSAELFGALIGVDPGSATRVIEEQGGTFAVYYVIERTTGGDGDREALRERVRRRLSQQKMAQNMEAEFMSELFKNRTIDKKI